MTIPFAGSRLHRAVLAVGVFGLLIVGFFWTDASWQGPFNPAWDVRGRHSNGNNIGFADGHSKYRPVSRTTIDLFGLPR